MNFGEAFIEAKSKNAACLLLKTNGMFIMPSYTGILFDSNGQVHFIVIEHHAINLDIISQSFHLSHMDSTGWIVCEESDFEKLQKGIMRSGIIAEIANLKKKLDELESKE